MSTLAWRNLMHDKVRLAVTLTGIVFAVVLMVAEFGLFLGFTTTTSSLIDRSGADLWVIAKHVPYIEQGVPFSERKLSTVLATPAVAEAQKYVAGFTQWQRPDGRQESVQVVGFNLDGRLGAPWNVVVGTLQDLKAPEAIFVDELYRDKLGVTDLGQVVEIRGYRARLVGFTRGIRAFTTAPVRALRLPAGCRRCSSRRATVSGGVRSSLYSRTRTTWLEFAPPKRNSV